MEGLSGSYEITVDNASADRLLTISGGGSGAAFPIVDGPFFSFSGTAVAVPEPVGLPVVTGYHVACQKRARHFAGLVCGSATRSVRSKAEP